MIINAYQLIIYIPQVNTIARNKYEITLINFHSKIINLETLKIKSNE